MTILSKDIDDNSSIDITLTIISMFIQEASKNISDLWRLDVLGITDPIKSITKEVHQAEIKISSRNKIYNEDRIWSSSILERESSIFTIIET